MTNAACITDTGGRVGAHKTQVWHDRQGQHQEHEENHGQEAGGQVSAGREDNKKAGARSGHSKDRWQMAGTNKEAEATPVD